MAHQFSIDETVEVRGYSKETDGIGKYIGDYGDHYRVRLFHYEDYFDDDDGDEDHHFIPKAYVFPYVETAYDPTQMGDRDDDI